MITNWAELYLKTTSTLKTLTEKKKKRNALQFLHTHAYIQYLHDSLNKNLK